MQDAVLRWRGVELRKERSRFEPDHGAEGRLVDAFAAAMTIVARYSVRNPDKLRHLA